MSFGNVALQAFEDISVSPSVRGFLHSPQHSNGDAIILTHGAGSNSNAPLLAAMAEAFVEQNYVVLRCDLPFRQQRASGPPQPGSAEADRAGLRNAVMAMRKLAAGRIFLGGHSYGGRQSTMLCSKEPDLVSGLLLLSYPLHPPRKPEQLRIQHLTDLQTPSLFVHGTRDPFGTVEEMEKALKTIPAANQLLAVEGAGHDLGFAGKKKAAEVPRLVLQAWARMFPQDSV
jgi:predicted alpha/beta-hydrolase family hydrolase